MPEPRESDHMTPFGAPMFDWQPRPRLVFGAGQVERAGELARELGGRRVLLVTDAGLSVTVYDRVIENPTTSCVEACRTLAQSARVDLIVGLGGGSSMDTAKGCNFLLTNGGRMEDYWGVGKATKPMLPLLAIPTTAGTGSECQSAALITREDTHQKMACLDPKAAARIALLDPELTLSQPERVAACTGIDALAHAVESAVTTRRNPISQTFSRQSYRLCSQNLPRVFAEPHNLEARGRMQLGAAFAGMAIENSMLGAAHAAANPLTARFGLVHGTAVGLMLPHVVRFNAALPEVGDLYAEVLEITGADAGSRLAAQLESMLSLAGMPGSLADCGVTAEAVPRLAEEAAKQWTAQFNPRPISAADFQQLYEAAFSNRGSIPSVRLQRA
ncbi:MAG: iron-containing alcohol dehydrogenase [Verrucomicrobia bacterium]|nr:iron-containing alcohol dehydrogenase [Verrucomicrobiota bacterium]